MARTCLPAGRNQKSGEHFGSVSALGAGRRRL